MTTRNHARPAGAEQDREPIADWRPNAGPDPLGERLVAAREAKGIDLLRAERETKIRRAYLAALERGDYASLPGGVYARGFLRNYAQYLGLDPEEAVAQWHREAPADAPEPVIVVPRPLVAPRKGLVLTSGVVVAAVVTVVVLAILAYIGFQLVRFSEPPPLRVAQPPTAVTEVAEGASTYTLRGTTVAGGLVTIEAPGRDSLNITAAGDGAWLATVELRRGKNQFDVSAVDPKTGKAAEHPVRLLISVPFSPVVAPTLAVDSPADGATFQNGAIPVAGHATDATTVNVAATYAGRAPGEVPAASAAPTPASPPPIDVTPADDGSFATNLDLTAGRWTLTIAARSDQGKTTTLTRNVTVVYRGVNVVVEVKGGRAWLKVWVDGVVSKTTGSGGLVVNDGQTLTFSGTTSVEVRTGNSGVTSFTVNGTSLGLLAKGGSPATWLFQPPDPPKRTDRKP
jgi:transcriptional regulator with XRE-family HTH domain/nitrogen fixation protein FixH